MEMKNKLHSSGKFNSITEVHKCFSDGSKADHHAFIIAGLGSGSSNNCSSAEKEKLRTIIDSGASVHLIKDRSAFRKISIREKVRIKGVSGASWGYIGILKPNIFGQRTRAVYFPDLPVAALISVAKLKSEGWEVRFSPLGDSARHLVSGALINLESNSNGLPSIKSLGTESNCYSESGFVCTSIGDVVDSFNVQQLTSSMSPQTRKAVAVAGRRRKRGGQNSKKVQLDRLLQHLRNAHISHGDKIDCIDCKQAKFKNIGADSTSSGAQKVNPSLMFFSGDFFGPVLPVSYRGSTVVMIFTCNTCQYIAVRCLKSKALAPQAVESFLLEIRSKCGADIFTGELKTELIAVGLRSDNEEVLKSKAMTDMCRRYAVVHKFSIPYMPWTNSHAERAVQSMKNSLRATMMHVDPRVWDYGLKHVAQAWNLTPRMNKDTGTRCAPLEEINHKTTNPLNKVNVEEKRKYLRRFGCLVVFRPGRTELMKQQEKNSVLSPRALRGINLGWSEENSCWQVGCFPTSSLDRFAVYQCSNAVFLEDVMVSDVKQLCDSSAVGLDEQILAKLKSSTASEAASSSVGDVVKHSAGDRRQRAQSGAELVSSAPCIRSDIATNRQQENKEKLGLSDVNKIFEVINLNKPQDGMDEKSDDKKQEQKDATGAQVPPNSTANKSNQPKIVSSPSSSTNSTESPNIVHGPPSKLPPPRTKKWVEAAKKVAKKMRKQQSNEHKPVNFTEEMYCHLAMEEGEELIEAEVFMSLEKEDDDPHLVKPGQSTTPSKAFHDDNPYRPKWIEATSIEAARLESYKCWRKLLPEDYNLLKARKLKSTPTALLLCRKRCGRFKARLVVLGNRWQAEANEDFNLYASVVSQVGNRCALVAGAKKRWHLKAFDIGNAFIRASIQNHKVIVSVPPQFREAQGDDGLRMLLKALYGLPISPKLWGDQISKDLKELGWAESDAEPGLWRLVVGHTVKAVLTIYVDDCIVTAETEELVDHLIKQVHDKHPVSMIEMRSVDLQGRKGAVQFDLLGADCIYHQQSGFLRISMENYIEKILKKFDMNQPGLKTVPSPDFEEAPLYDSKSPPSTIKFRAVVGALQWLCVTARPDLASATNKLARATANPVNKAMEAAARRVLRYVAGTRSVGIEYSPDIERKFYNNLLELQQHPENKNIQSQLLNHPITTYGDASFASTFKAMRSVSGIVVYMHGFPVAWKSQPQSVTTTSSMEAEWVAASKAIELAEGPQLLMQFLRGDVVGNKEEVEKGPILCDNRSAVLSGRKRATELQRATRHIAIKHAKVNENGSRIVFVPTDLQRADGLTKTSNSLALDLIFPQNDKFAFSVSQELDFVGFFIQIL